MKLIASTTTTENRYGRQSEPVVRSETFRHNKGKFAVFANNGEYCLTALPTVIQETRYGTLGRTAPLPEAKDGDLIEVDGVVYRVTDDKRGYDPRLVPVEGLS